MNVKWPLRIAAASAALLVPLAMSSPAHASTGLCTKISPEQNVSLAPYGVQWYAFASPGAAFTSALFNEDVKLDSQLPFITVAWQSAYDYYVGAANNQSYGIAGDGWFIVTYACS